MAWVLPSGKAADVLGRETGTPATTLAKLLYEHGRPEGPPPEWQLGPGTTVILDEAGMASTEDLARLVELADRRRWRLVCVGDPAQLPAVVRGGMFAHWCESFPAHHLDEVRRFHDAWQGEASLLLRQGDPACAVHYAEHGRLENADEVFAAAVARPPNARTAHAVREQLYRAAGASPPAVAQTPETLSEDPARRMAERLKQLPTFGHQSSG